MLLEIQLATHSMIMDHLALNEDTEICNEWNCVPTMNKANTRGITSVFEKIRKCKNNLDVEKASLLLQC